MRRTTRLGLIALAVIASLGLALAAGLHALTRADPPAGTLAALATVPLRTADGRPTVLGALAPVGRTTIVTFWASWCVPCLAETRVLVAARARYAPADLAIIAINLDEEPRDAARMARFLDRTGGGALTQALGDRATYAALTGRHMLQLPRGFAFDRTGAPTLSMAGFEPDATERTINAALANAIGH